VFVDECGAHTSLALLYAWSRIGERACLKVPRNWGANIHLAGEHEHRGGMGPSLVVEGSTTREVFEAYLERLLAPVLRPGQVVVMDNLSSHKGSRVRQLISRRGAASYCTCHPTRPTSTYKKGRFPRSSGS